LEDVARSIIKTNCNVDMRLKEGVKLSTLTTGAHIGNPCNKGDKVEGVEVKRTMSICIIGVSSAINTEM
jgi:hypothetical protein